MQFTTIGLIGRLHSNRVKSSVERLIQLLISHNRNVVVDDETATHVSPAILQSTNVTIVSMNTLGESSDLAVVVGGDGSILGAARDLVHYDVPLLGVNRGRLGFLADVMPADIETKVGEVLSGNYVTEQRFLLDMKVLRGGGLIHSGDALNDVVLHPGELIRMLEFELYIDGLFVASQRSDGMIVSTPTGSTAYALSGGGPIMHPKLDAIVLVPMNSHTLSSRPIVVGSNCEIKIIVGKRSTAKPQVTCDGQTHDTLMAGDEIIITKKPKQLQLVHPTNDNFYERCRSKLGWGGHFPGE